MFFYSVKQQWTTSRLDSDTWWKTASDDRGQWLDREAPKHFPKPDCTKIRSQSLFGGLLLVWSTTAFWIPVKPRRMLSKLMRCTENCSPYSQYWLTKRAQFFSLTMPNYTTNASKVGWTGIQSFASSAIFTWPLANRLPLLQASQQLFAGKTLPQPAKCRKRFPRVHQIPKHGSLCYWNKQTYFSLAKMCWL